MMLCWMRRGSRPSEPVQRAVPTNNSESAKKSRVLRFTSMSLPARQDRRIFGGPRRPVPGSSSAAEWREARLPTGKGEHTE